MVGEIKQYKRVLNPSELSHKVVPANENFEIIPNRLFYYYGIRKGCNVWIRTGQGHYNFMLANNYRVSYIDNAVKDESEF